MEQLPDYVTEEYLNTLCLIVGKGSGKQGERCAIQEVRAWLDIDASSDAVPDCVCPVIGKLVIGLNDVSDDYRRQIVPILPRILNTRAELAVTVKRAFAVADWAVRVVAVVALRSADLNEQADSLVKLDPIADEKAASYAARAASYASDAARAASYASYAASDASYAASYAARAASYAARAAAISPVAILETLLVIQ
jgi:hypothetical protein